MEQVARVDRAEVNSRVKAVGKLCGNTRRSRSVRSTAWSSLLGVGLLAAVKIVPHDVAVQETTLATKREARKAWGDFEARGWGSGFGEALVTEQNGHSEGTSILRETAIARS